MAWDKKYRPKTFGDVIGQDGTCQVLRARITRGSGLDSSYVLAGPAGCGKTSLARILARALLCQHRTPEGEPCNACDSCQAILGGASVAFRELDAASSGTIDNVRRIVDDLSYAVLGAERRIVLFDEMHRMTRDAQDVLLKPLEEKRLVGIFCTTEPHKIRSTISSRCETHSIRFPTREELLERALRVLNAEGVPYEEPGVLTTIDYCGGHVRDVLNRLEMVSQMGPVTEASVREYLDLGAVSTYYDILLSLGSPQRAIALAEDLCDRVGPEEVLSGLAEAAMNSWRQANKMAANFAQMDRVKAQEVYQAYGDTCLALAEYMLSTRRTTTIGVTCALLSCSKGVPSRGATEATTVQVVIAAAPAAPEAVVQSAPAPVTAEGPPAQSVPSGAPSGMPSQPPPAPAKVPTTDELTALERRARPPSLPRGAARAPKTIAVSPVQRQTILTPAEARAGLLKVLGRLASD